jgi:hypothetical protein
MVLCENIILLLSRWLDYAKAAPSENWIHDLNQVSHVKKSIKVYFILKVTCGHILFLLILNELQLTDQWVIEARKCV